MEIFEPLEEQQQTPKRPVLLKVLGILTFINLGIAALFLLGAITSGPLSRTQMDTAMEPSLKQAEMMDSQGMGWMADQMEKVVQFNQHGNNAFYLMQAFNAGVVIFGIMGVMMMFQRKRIGFHLYIISCIIRIASFYTLAPLAEVPTLIVGYYLFTSVLFGILYSRCLSWANQ